MAVYFMKTYILTLDGCDDSTEIKLSLSDEQRDFLLSVEKQIKEAASYGCQPTLSLAESINKTEEV